MFDVDDEHPHRREVRGWLHLAGMEARAVAAEAAGRTLSVASSGAIAAAVRLGLLARRLRTRADGLTAKPPVPEWYETEPLPVDWAARVECMRRHPSAQSRTEDEA